MKFKGFTLKEMLIVIAIIAILVAILFPVFVIVREKVRTAPCINNLKQIGTAFEMYMNDYNQCFPALPESLGSEIGDWHNYSGKAPYEANKKKNGSKDWSRDVNYTTQLKPYVKNMQIFKCKSDTEASPEPLVEGKRITSYRYKYWIAAASNKYDYPNVNGNYYPVLRKAALGYPDSIVILSELDTFHNLKRFDKNVKIVVIFSDTHARVMKAGDCMGVAMDQKTSDEWGTYIDTNWSKIDCDLPVDPKKVRDI